MDKEMSEPFGIRIPLDAKNVEALYDLYTAAESHIIELKAMVGELEAKDRVHTSMLDRVCELLKMCVANKAPEVLKQANNQVFDSKEDCMYAPFLKEISGVLGLDTKEVQTQLHTLVTEGCEDFYCTLIPQKIRALKEDSLIFKTKLEIAMETLKEIAKEKKELGF